MGTARNALFGIDVEWRPIAPQARLLWGTAATLVALVPLTALVIVGAVAGGPPALVGGLAVSGAVLAMIWWFVGRRYRAWGFALRQHDLVIRRGVLVRRLTIVPLGRMQFVDIAQGPLDRMLGVAAVQLHTAAAASDAKIPLLPADEARELRDRLTALGEARSSGT